MISATCWVPRGMASEFPEQYELDDEEMARIEEMAKLHLGEDGQGQLEEEEEAEGEEKINKEVKVSKLKSEIEIDDDLKEYDLEHYDDDLVDETGEKITMFPGLTNTSATYIKKTRKVDGEEGDEMEVVDEEGDEELYLSLPTDKDTTEEKAELQVYQTDNMILATRTEDDISYLDVYVYDDGAGAPQGSNEEEGDRLDPDVARGMTREKNLYIHHDLMLPAFPLCVEWMSFVPGGANDDSNVGNFAAIGTFEPTIEIWNLDSIDKAFPDVILGENEFEAASSASRKKKSKKSKKKKSTHVTTHHTDAVLSLSHNTIFRNVLASTSADATVKLWDLTTCTAARSMNSIHQGKHVSASQWFNNSQAGGDDNGYVLLTGGYDSTCCITDVRINDEKTMSKRYSLGNTQEEIESVSWDSVKPVFYAGTDLGNVYAFDARQESKPLWTLHAHDSGISSLQNNKYIDGMFVSGAMGDKLVKLWKVNEEQPSLVLSRDFGCGNVLTSSFAPDIEVAGNLIVGGSGAGLKMWDSFSNRAVRGTFKDQLIGLQKRARAEANASGRASRIARKYGENYGGETVMEAETGGVEEEEEGDEE